MQQSVCLFHNGNSRIIEFYQKKYSELKFCNNWAEANETPATGCLWEICFSDATVDNLLLALKHGIKIVRHISTYQDDMEYILPECEKFEYDQWLNNVVANHLCFATEVISDIAIPSSNSSTVIITTGRTANTHLQEIYKSKKLFAFECSKKLDSDFFNARNSVFLWRQDQWNCLASTWIAMQTNYTKSHNVIGRRDIVFEQKVNPLTLEWINSEWSNLCQIILNQAMVSKYVCNKPTSFTTSEFIVANFKTVQQPLPYRKQDLIPNYNEVHQWYVSSDLAKNLDTMYNNVIKHLTPWGIE